jgi:small-conductance mechanosensitive channel
LPFFNKGKSHASTSNTEATEEMITDKNLSGEIISTLGITLGGIALFYIIFYFIKRWANRKKSFIPGLIDKNIHLPGLLFFIFIALNLNIEKFRDQLDPKAYQVIKHWLEILLIAASGFLVARIISLFKDIVIHFYERQKRHDYKLRKVKTQYLLIQRVLNMLILFMTVAAAALTFNQFRSMGRTVLASAGIAGIVIGFAAQKSLGSILAGIQIAIAQPIKIDDTVVVEDIFGTVAEISLTYVVINTWDEKRLIVPISYFLDKPFENWTRASPEVVGKVKVYADYTLPVAELRPVFEKWLEESVLWDKRKRALLVTDASEKAIVVRATMSAKNADDAFDLECLIREKLITYIREHYPQSLPKERMNINNTSGPDERI